jgi:uncharacterized protein (DUF1778 family)
MTSPLNRTETGAEQPGKSHTLKSLWRRAFGNSAPGGASCGVRSPYPSSAPGVAEVPGAGAAPGVGPGAPTRSAEAGPARFRRLRQPALRDHRVHPRFSDTEYDLLQRAATHCSMTLGGYTAEAALAAARAENPEAAIADYRRLVKELMAANRQLAAIGNNLNQLARHLNTGGTFPEQTAVQCLLTYVEAAIGRADDAVDHVIRR